MPAPTHRPPRRLQRLRSVVSSGVNPMSEQEMDLHTIRWVWPHVRARKRCASVAAEGTVVSRGTALAAALAAPSASIWLAAPPCCCRSLREELGAEGVQPPRPLVAVHPNDSLAAVVRTLFERGCSMAPVLSSNSQGEPAGLGGEWRGRA